MSDELVLNQNNDLQSKQLDEDSLFNLVKINETESEHLAAEPYSYWKSVFRVFIKKPSARISIICLIALILSAIIIPLFATETPGC